MPSFGNREPDPSARESVIYRIHPEREGKKLVFQLGTAGPELAVQAARVVAGDVAGIDVNSGCPKPFSTLGGMGAALLKDPDRLVSILEALVKEIVPEFQIGISVKIRILEDPKDTEMLVRRLVATGITGLTVHCRTTPMRPRERAIRDQMRMVADICREAGVACLMNGDVTNYDEAQALAKEYGCDGGMIATAAEANPTVFRSKADGGPFPRGHVVREFVETALDVENRWGNTKFCLAQVMPLKDQRQLLLQKSKCHEELVNALGFTDLLEKAKAIDASVGLTSEGKAKLKANKKQAQKEARAQAMNGVQKTNGIKRSERSPEREMTTPKKAKVEEVEEQHMATMPQAMSAAV
jgi:tRNA-dihydrouridine synthase 2